MIVKKFWTLPLLEEFGIQGPVKSVSLGIEFWISLEQAEGMASCY